MTLIRKIQLTKELTLNSPFLKSYGRINSTIEKNLTVKYFKRVENLVALRQFSRRFSKITVNMVKLPIIGVVALT